jgi:hypothetical protein
MSLLYLNTLLCTLTLDCMLCTNEHMLYANTQPCTTRLLSLLLHTPHKQSNLRVATTAAPVNAGGGGGHAPIPMETKKIMRMVAAKFAGYSSEF